MPLSRRAFLNASALTAGAVLLDGPAALAGRPGHVRRPAAPLAATGTFDLGVAAGYPGTSDATLWTRLGGVSRDARVGVEVARDAGFRHVVFRSSPVAAKAVDFTVHQHVTGLKPGEQYFYRFHTSHTHSGVGRMRTRRPADSREPVRIGVFSCQSYEAGYYTAHAGLAKEEDLDLVLCLGDYIYEHHYYDGPDGRKDTLGPNKDGDVQTLPEYREKYRFYKADKNLQAMHAAHAYVPIWDDHEVEDNYAGKGADSISKDPAKTENDDKTPRRVPIGARRANGYRAWAEYMPRRGVSRQPPRIYGTVPLGAHATVFITDERQYRSPQPCGDALASPCADNKDPRQTMLGPGQRAWFLDALRRDRATWKLWGSEVMLMAWDSAPGTALNEDGWDGYQAEREQILGYVKDKGIKNLAVLTGDIHTYVAGTLHVDGRTDTPAVGTEFVGGSITSQGLDKLDALVGLLKSTNSHIDYINAKRRGYMVVDAGPSDLRVKFRSPASVLNPASAIETIGSFRVAKGSTTVETV